MKVKYLMVVGFFGLIGCAGPSVLVQPLTESAKPDDIICVVDSNDADMEIQGVINITLLELGFNPRPISGVAAAESNRCKVYIVYGTSYETDIVSFLSAIRLTAYNATHDRIGYAQGSIANNLSLGKFKAGEKVTADAVKRLFAL
tara:strand:+ start:1706 stop:2140 length:435 start_codon:yes stop_codon:yes gene_type:complete